GQGQLLALQRSFVVILAVVAWAALRYYQNVLAMALTAYTIIGAGLTPAVLAAFLWKRVTVAGGVASIAGGMATTIGITIANSIHKASHSGADWLPTDYIAIPAAIVSAPLPAPAPQLTKPSPR